MVDVCGADKAVVGNVHQVPDLADLPRHFVHELFGRDVLLFRLVLDLLSVLVRARLKAHVVSLFAFEAREAVGQHDLVRVADVRLGGGVRDRGRNIIRFFLAHN